MFAPVAPPSSLAHAPAGSARRQLRRPFNKGFARGPRRVPGPSRASASEVTRDGQVDQGLNPRVASLRESKTMALTDLARSMKEAGQDVIGLAAGEPDFDTPSAIVEAGCAAIRGGKTRYSPNTGTAGLRAAVCEKLAEENGVRYAPNEIVLSNGAKQSVAQGVIAVRHGASSFRTTYVRPLHAPSHRRLTCHTNDAANDDDGTTMSRC